MSESWVSDKSPSIQRIDKNPNRPISGDTYKNGISHNTDLIGSIGTPKIEPVDIDSDIRTGGVFAAVFNLTNGIIGSSMLATPYTIYCTGFVTGMIFIHITYYDGLFVPKERNTNLSKMCGNIFGVSEICILIYATGCMIVYFVIVGQFIKSFLDSFIHGDYFFNNQKIITTFFGIVVIYPLTLIRESKKLSGFSILAVVGIVYLNVFIVVYAIYMFAENRFGVGISQIFWFQTELNKGTYYPLFFLAIPIQFLLFICHPLVFPVSYEIKNGNVVKADIVVFFSIIICSIAYFSSGIFGFFSFGIELQDNILNNYPGGNIFATIGKFMIGINLIFSFPLQNYGARLAVKSILLGENKKLGTYAYIIITTVYFLANLIVALFVPQISTIFGLIGAIACVTLILLIPALLCWKVIAKQQKTWFGRYFCYFYSIFLIVLSLFFGTTGLVASIFKLIENFFGVL